MMKKCIRGFSILILGIVVMSLSSCASCQTPYRRELSQSNRSTEANESYKKAIAQLDKAECASTPTEATEIYTAAEPYLSDAIFKLKEMEHNKNINVSEDVYYCEKIKRETDVKIGAADRAK